MRFWLSNNDGKASGPFELQEIRAMAGRGALSPEAQVCIEGGNEWHPLSSVITASPAPNVPSTPPISPVTPEWARTTFHGYAGFWKRFAAFVIDFILLMIIGFAVGVTIALIMAAGGSRDTRGAEALGNVAGILINWIYYAAMESSRLQATLGKLALGIKVTDLEGQRISFGRSTGRNFAKFFSGILLGVGFIKIAFTKRKQGLHDQLAGTLVVNG
jgi:uncharacterized RDD family membrane protein YckC